MYQETFRSDKSQKVQHYNTISQILHWLMAVCILVMFALGWGREILPAAWRGTAMDVHKSLGILTLGLACFRGAWRFYKKPPNYPLSMARHLKTAAHITHVFLYFMFFVMPVSGWLVISAMGKTTYFFGAAVLPPLIDKNPAIVPELKIFHEISAYLLITIIILHIGAALFHHIVLKDKILSRMLSL